MSNEGRERVATREVASALDISYDDALRLLRKVREQDHHLRGENLTEAVEKLRTEEKGKGRKSK